MSDPQVQQVNEIAVEFSLQAVRLMNRGVNPNVVMNALVDALTNVAATVARAPDTNPVFKRLVDETRTKICGLCLDLSNGLHAAKSSSSQN